MKNTYRYVNVNGKTELEHRVIMESMLGRKLLPDEVVHHKNELKYDNRPENLQLISNSEHTKLHHKDTEYIILKCAYCGKEVIKFERDIRYKRKQGTSNFYCDKSCAARHKIDLGITPPLNKKYTLDINSIIKEGLNNGLTGYAIAKMHNLNKKTVYNRINSM